MPLFLTFWIYYSGVLFLSEIQKAGNLKCHKLYNFWNQREKIYSYTKIQVYILYIKPYGLAGTFVFIWIFTNASLCAILMFKFYKKDWQVWDRVAISEATHQTAKHAKCTNSSSISTERRTTEPSEVPSPYLSKYWSKI